MNKIYLEPVNKARDLIDGVKKQSDLLAKKGISIDVDLLSKMCRDLEDAGSAQDKIEAELKVARENAHRCLELLKTAYNSSKAPIKQNFAPETWQSFGLADKK